MFVRGGPGRLVEALAAAARGFGTEIRTGAEVRSISVREERVDGVILENGDHIEAATVISGADPKRTLLGLLDPSVIGPQMGWQAGNLRLKGSVAKVDLALSALPSLQGLATDDGARRIRGRILVAPSVGVLDHAADAVKAGRVADELILEATIPSLVDPSLIDDATGGAHVMSVLVQGVPFHRRDGVDWDADREALGERVIAQLESVAPGIGALVTGRRVLTPLDLERDYGLTEGHPLHGEPSLDQWFAWRPMLGLARYRLPVEGLYLCASGAHPGGGVTGQPGRNAAREIDRRPQARDRPVSRRRSLAVVLGLVVAMTAIAGCTITGTVVASEIVDEQLTVEPMPAIIVETFNGRINVVAGGDTTIDVRVTKRGSGTSQADAESDLRRVEVSVVQEPDRVTVTARRTDGATSLGNSGADVELSVPRDARLELRTSNGRIEAANVAGPIVARTSNGGVVIRDATDIDAETTNGPLTITESSGRLDVRTSNGSLDLIAVEEAIVTAETSNGAITLSGTLGPGEHRLRTENAAIRISFPGSAEFSIVGRTSNGRISTDFPLTIGDDSITGTVGDEPDVLITAVTSNGDLAVMSQTP